MREEELVQTTIHLSFLMVGGIMLILFDILFFDLFLFWHSRFIHKSI